MNEENEDRKTIEKLLGYILGFFVECWIVMLLWNWLTPMFGINVQLTYWQSFGLLVLCSYLFKNNLLEL